MNAKKAMDRPLFSLACIGLIACMLNGCARDELQASSESATSMEEVSQEQLNKLVVMRYMDALNTSEYASVAKELLSPRYEMIRAEFRHLSHNASSSELETMAEPINLAISDRRNSVDIIMGEGDYVAVRYRILGTHTGNLYGIPATNADIDIDAAAIFRLHEGKIKESWFMADEAGLLIQIGKPLPARADGGQEAPLVKLTAVSGDEHLAALLENPMDSREYRNKLMVNAYKSENPPEGILPPSGRYEQSLRRGFRHLIDSSREQNRGGHAFDNAFPDRVDMVSNLIADGKRVMIQFRLTATNTESLFGIPALGNKVEAYEIGFMEFDGDHWKYAWFLGDDLGMLLQMGGPQDFWFKDAEQ